MVPLMAPSTILLLKTKKGVNLIFAPFFRYIDMQYVNKNNTSWTFDCNVFDAVGSVNLIVYNTNDRTTQEFTKGRLQYTYENNTISFTEVVQLEEGVRYEFRIESNNKSIW